jgi:glucokinase
LSIAFIDWGGTNFRCVVEGEKSLSFAKPSQNIDILFELKSLFENFPHITKVGISFAGQVQNNIILSAPNIKARELDLNAHFKDKKIFVQNDLKCAALAEAQYYNESSVAVLYVGTGIGSAYIEDSKLISGYANIAGEIGHIPYRANGSICGCGKDNCLELTASGSGLAKMAKMAGIEFCNLEELRQNEKGSKILYDFEDGVGHGASLIVTMLNPKLLVIGGGIIKSNQWLLKSIQSNIAKNAFAKSASICEVKISQLEDGSLEGAKLIIQ